MPIAPTDFAYLQTLLQEHSAIVLEAGKEYLVEFRIEPVLRSESVTSVCELVKRLRARPFGELHQKVVEVMTTNETFFFRDHHPFEALERTILPSLSQQRRVTIWSAASSSGQEAYSITMLLAENPRLANGDVRVLGTDLSQEMIARARRGRYSQMEVNRGLPAARLVKHFDRLDNEWQVKPHLKRFTEFRCLNLNHPWHGIEPMDVVFLRNVLIYFDDPTKRSVLEKVRRVLKPGGYLFLGSSETPLGLDRCFERVQIGRSICYRLVKGPS